MSKFPSQYYSSAEEDYFDEDEYFDEEDYFEVENNDELDEYIDSRGGIDKCMNCGKYKYNDELNYSPQVCKIPCRNPQEY